ncbi:neuronal acetylcholine receptor subunit alpha-10-like isoform X1 [Saccostrea cucullata]|uniref:neuronal acetylcholine receptor subunit alpha-10-like isoform X1 n=2 Tax=Saccostrea cuccullata TaxID=36930 RepID=UPI002ED1DC43
MHVSRAVSAWISLILSFIIEVATQSTANQQALHTHLFTSYDAGEKPYCGGSVNVTLDMALRQVIDLDEPQQILKINVWVRLKWQDCRLTWTPASFGNIGNFIVPYKYIWIPDLTLYDSVSGEFVGLKEYRPNIYPDGTVYYNFPSVLESLCTVDVEKFPYDEQTCKLLFGSWAYHGYDLDLQNKNPEGDLSSAVTNVEWTYVSMKAERHVLYYGCCPEPYPDVTYYLKLRRKPKFYLINLIIPSMLITVMAALGYYLPVESGEKVSLQITVMLSLAVFQLLVADKLPPSADATPVIATYFNFSLFLVGLACLMAVVVLAIHYQGNRRMPDWLYKYGLIKLSCITFVHVENNAPVKEEKQNTVKTIMVKGSVHKVRPEQKKTKGSLHLMEYDQPVVVEEKEPVSEKDPDDTAPKRIYQDDWKKFACVVDRLSFYMFVIIGTIGTGIVFSQFGM